MKNPFEKPNTDDKAKKPKKSEKTQAEIRKALEERLLGMKGVIRSAMEEYEQALKEKSFEDKEGEAEGSGEKRREAAQATVNVLFERAEQMKKKLASKEKLPNYTDSLAVNYINPSKQKENIIINIDQKISEFVTLYQQVNKNLPPNFEDQAREVWENNIDAIQKAIEENGFDEMLIIPAIAGIVDISEKMKMENGYYDYIKSNSNVQTMAGIPLVPHNGDKFRIVLVHKTQNLKDRPELKQTLKVKGQDLNLDHILTLEDYLVFQRKYFGDTRKHLDEEGWTCLATKSGSRLVSAAWNPAAGKLEVGASDLDSQYADLGARPSRSFF